MTSMMFLLVKQICQITITQVRTIQNEKRRINDNSEKQL